MRWIDGHLDLAYLAVNGRDLRVPCPDPRAGCVSLPGLRDAGVEMALATIFTEVAGSGPPGSCSPHDSPHVYRGLDDLEGAHRAGMRQLEVYEQLEREGRVRIVRSGNDLGVGDDGPLRILILMEGADPIRSPREARQWYERGVRMVGLAWAMGTRYAGGNARPGPLTAAGIELVHALDELGVIHDLSHLADPAADQLLSLARGPVAATHSNCRALLKPSERHLRDDQIRAIGGRQGIVGLNLYSRFLAIDRRATIADCLAHVQHVAEVMGHRRGVALGSDLDGGFTPDDLPIDLDHPSKLGRLAEALREAGWSDEEVEGFAQANWMRILQRHLACAPGPAVPTPRRQ